MTPKNKFYYFFFISFVKKSYTFSHYLDDWTLDIEKISTNW